MVCSAGFPATAESADTVIYANDFATSAGSEWSLTNRDTTPSGRTFLGRFVNDTQLSLSLGQGSPIYSGGLPAHDSLTISFNLFMIKSWDGNSGPPDLWTLDVEGGPTLLHTTFSNPLHSVDTPQSYPDAYGVGVHPAQTGAAEIDTLGYSANFGDSVYALSFTFAHSADSVKFWFVAEGFTGTPLPPGLDDESWGLDNVTVTAIPEPATLLLLALGGAALVRRRRVARRTDRP